MFVIIIIILQMVIKFAIQCNHNMKYCHYYTINVVNVTGQISIIIIDIIIMIIILDMKYDIMLISVCPILKFMTV